MGKRLTPSERTNKNKANVIHKIDKDKWSERMKQFYSKTFRRITPSSVGRLIELNGEAVARKLLR